MIIRQEKIEDYEEVYTVVKEAFESTECSDGHEQDLVVVLRESNSFIPKLSLVAVEDNKIVGHILFTKAIVQGVEILALAPLSVLPKYQNRGIGLSLMKKGHSIAKMFFASTFWTLLQNFFGHCCMSKLDKVAKHWLALNWPAKQALQTFYDFITQDMEMVILFLYPRVHVF